MNQASFECTDRVVLSHADEALIFFLVRLVDRIEALGPAPRVDIMRYARKIKSFRN